MKISTLTAVVVFALAPGAPAATNVVLILADDQGWTGMSVHG